MTELHTQSNRNRQGGAALVVGLVMLTVMTMLTVASTRSMRLEQQMANNARELNEAFQGAEAAARDAQRCVQENLPRLPVPLPDQYGFYEGQVDPSAAIAHRYLAADWDWDNANQAITYAKTGFEDAASQPQYYVNRIQMGQSIPPGLEGNQSRNNSDDAGTKSVDSSLAYQVTARGLSKDGGAQVIVQTAVRF